MKNPRFKEYKLVCLREQPADFAVCDTPELAAAYWRSMVVPGPLYRAEQEQLIVLHLNTRRRITGHWLYSIGTKDTINVDKGEIFRTAIVAGAKAILLMHNHPSGDPTPSEADIRVTRDLICGGQVLQVDVVDHVIMGRATAERPCGHCSLRDLGYFHS